jgi:hypothetical protein
MSSLPNDFLFCFVNYHNCKSIAKPLRFHIDMVKGQTHNTLKNILVTNFYSP